MTSAEGFVAAVPTADRERYRQHAEASAAVFRDHGALEVVECWGDDVPNGVSTSFPLAARCAPDETVVFAWVAWPSREARDDGMAGVMADPRMQPTNPMPFDGARMVYGGFGVIVRR